MHFEPIPDWPKPWLVLKCAALSIEKAYQVGECCNIFFSYCQTLWLSCCWWSNNGISNSSVLVKWHGKSRDDYCRFWGNFLSRNLKHSSVNNFSTDYLIGSFYFYFISYYHYCFYNCSVSEYLPPYTIFVEVALGWSTFPSQFSWFSAFFSWRVSPPWGHAYLKDALSCISFVLVLACENLTKYLLRIYCCMLCKLWYFKHVL